MSRHEFLVAALSASCLFAPASAGAGDRVDRLAWMSGCWEQGSGRDVTQEHWMAPAGGVMLGVSRSVSGGREVGHEYLRIDEQGGVLVLTAAPSGQGRAAFREATADGARIVFENPAHDFPQRISYDLRDGGFLIARIEGPSETGTRAIDFVYRRVPCPSGAAEDAAAPPGSASPAASPAVEPALVVVESLYDLATFDAGGRPDWQAIRALFLEDAVIVLRTGRERTTVFSLDGFLDDFRTFAGRQEVLDAGFSERIVRVEPLVFGDIAHVLVLYMAAINGSSGPPQRGVDSIALVRKDGAWRIASIINELPGPGRPLPAALAGDDPGEAR